MKQNLACTYVVSDILPRAKTQAVSSADRPVCALTAALASRERDNELFGLWRQMDKGEQGVAFQEAFLEMDVPFRRAEQWARGVNGERLPALPADLTYRGFTLDPYQVAAVNHMTVAGGTLALGCGLGKTVSAVAAAMHALRTGNATRERCWVICPVNAFGAWKAWVPLLSTEFLDVKVISLDSLHKVHPAAEDGGVVIFDEVHLLGHMTAKRTKQAHRIRTAFDFGLALTGTLLHGGIEKTLSMLDLAVPGAAGFGNRWNCGEYFNCLVRKTLGSRTVTELARPTGIAKERFLEWLTRTCITLNRNSAIVTQTMSLPGQDVEQVHIGEPFEDIDDLVAQTAQELLDSTGELPSAQAVAHLLCRSGVEQKVEWLMNLLDENTPDTPVVVFAQYHDTLDTVEDALRSRGLVVARVDGGVTGDDRIAVQRRFQAGEVQIFLGQIEASGVAMDLFRAHISVAFDHTWKAAAYNQALARTCRRGQQNHCKHYDLVANHLQARVVQRLVASEDFDASAAEYMAVKFGVAKATLDMI